MLSQSGLVVIAAWVRGPPGKRRDLEKYRQERRDWTSIEVGSFTEQY